MRKMSISIMVLAMLLLFGADLSIAEEDEDIEYENAYFEITPDIVSNVKGKAKYIRTRIQLMTNRADMLYELETHAPLFRHVLLMNLVDKKGETIQTPQGKESLRKELLKALSKALDEKVETKGLLTDLFFTTYYVK